MENGGEYYLYFIWIINIFIYIMVQSSKMYIVKPKPTPTLNNISTIT